jgi:asparagine synthetase A
MRYALINFPNMDAPLFTSMPSIRRDVQEKSGEVMVNFNYYIEYRLINEVNPTEQILPLLKNVLMMINGINRHEKFKAFRSPNYITDKVNFITISELHKKYPTLALNDALNRYVVANGLTFVSGVYQPLVNGKRLLIGSPTTDDYSNSGILYDFNEITSTVISLIKVSIRPSHELIKKQIIIDLPNELEKQIYQKTALNQKINFVPSIGIQIYFSHLMLINLKKMHLCEVVHSPCSIALSKYFADNEIEVM